MRISISSQESFLTLNPLATAMELRAFTASRVRNNFLFPSLFLRACMSPSIPVVRRQLHT
jgi:hypothetical protein